MKEEAFDVIVAGGGNAALSAALSAAKTSSKVLLLEKAAMEDRGGNTKYVRDIRYAHGDDKYTTGPYSEEELLDDLIRVTGKEIDLDLAKLTIRRSREIPQWLEENGVKITKAFRGTLHLGRTNLFPLGGGKAMVNAYYQKASKANVEVSYESAITKMHTQDGVVEGVTVMSGGKTREYRTGALVVAAGGFESNVSWLKEYWGDAADNFVIRGTRHNNGEMLRMLLQEGAKRVGDPRNFHSTSVDARAPKYDGGIVTRIDAIPFGITVNAEAQRFYDEGEDLWPKRYAIWGKMIAAQPNQIAYSIVDSKVKGLFLPSVWPPFMADSVGELANQMGLDSDRMTNVVSTYNKSVADGGTYDPSKLDDCHTLGLTPSKSHWALRIDTPPFYAYPLRPGITFTYMGVAVDAQAHVLREDGTPFKNLYAAGEIMSGNILKRGYLGGFGLTIGTAFGRIAGEEACRQL
ncbi:MAG: FAD-dependent tricarballylate dehydrogenase TcuA [Nitrososphaerota archaeon]|nr:FAD-dependent tricarballylate dehydrogenase TcuA [Nitrososphaerota archaeon]